MAIRPPRPCRKPGCSELTRAGWCLRHTPPRAARKATEDWHWMYNTAIWVKRLRPAQLLREPFCRECAARRMRTPATVVDHIVPHRGDWELFADPANHQSLCKQHHDAKTMRELGEKKKKSARRKQGNSG